MLIAFLAPTAHETASSAKAAPAFPPFETWHMPSQLFWLAILFTVLYLTLSRFILPRLSDTIEKRSDRIAADLDQAARLQDQAKDAQQALELRIAEAKSKARDTAAKAKEKIDADVSAQTLRTDAEIEKKLEAADARIDKMRTKALKNVESIAIETVEVITAQFGVKATPAKLAKAVSSALES